MTHTSTTVKSSVPTLSATYTLSTVSGTAPSSTSSLSNATAPLPIPTKPSLPASTQNQSRHTCTPTPVSLTSTDDIPTSTSPPPTVTPSPSDREIQEAASFLASLAESHALSPLHLPPQQHQNPVTLTDTAANPVSSAGTSTTSSALGISGICRVVQSNPYLQEVSAVYLYTYMYMYMLYVHVFCHCSVHIDD